MKRRLALLRSVIFFAALQPWLLPAQQTPQPSFPQTPPWHWPGPWHMWGGWGFWWLFPLLMMVIIAICIGGFFFGHRWGPWHMREHHRGLRRSWGDPTDSALKILNERFARGEIQKEEYEEKRAVIRSAPSLGK